MQFYLTHTEKHLQKFGKLDFNILKNETDVKFRRCYNDNLTPKFLNLKLGNKILQYFKPYKSHCKAASLCGKRGSYCLTSIIDNA